MLKSAFMQPAKYRFIIGARLLQTEEGLKTSQVTKNYPAYRAGLKVGDIILMADTTPVTDANSFSNYLTDRGGTTQLIVKRSGNIRYINVNSVPVELQ